MRIILHNFPRVDTSHLNMKSNSDYIITQLNCYVYNLYVWVGKSLYTSIHCDIIFGPYTTVPDMIIYNYNKNSIMNIEYSFDGDVLLL